MQKRKKLSKREIAERAQVKKQLQAEGILPPDKTPLNRKRFAQEVRAAWEEADGPLYAYVMRAIGWMLPFENARKVTPEQIGVLKLLKIALATKRFEDELPEGTHQYNSYDFYKEVVEPIIKL